MSSILEKRLRTLHETSGLNRSEVAKWIGVTPGTYRTWVTGRVPNDHKMAAVSNVILEIENAVRRGLLPLGLDIRQYDRMKAIMEIRDAVRRPIPKSRSAKPR